MAGRFFVVGDIHGCARELERLLAALRLGGDDTIAFVGDYIDRGPDSRAVLDQVIGLRDGGPAATVFLKGNHEDMCLSWLGRGGSWGESWGFNGGAATLRSWGLDARTSPGDAVGRIPPAHLAFLEALLPAYFAEGHLLVHAGIRPDATWEEQDEEDLYWIREEFILHPHRLPQTVVFGHTPQREVFVDLPYKIGIDTGCVYGGRLTCLELRARELHQIRLGEGTVTRGPMPLARPARRGLG